MKSMNGLQRFWQQAYLLRLLVRRNIKNQYYRSFIGVLWTVLNPLLNMLVMMFVFSSIFGTEGITLDYPIYILSGNIIFNIMRTSTAGSLPCLVHQRDMLQKTKVSIRLFPAANVISSLVTFAFSFVALLLVGLIRFASNDFSFHWQIVFILILLPAVTLFSLGLSYFLSALYVFFRDIEHIYSVLRDRFENYGSQSHVPLCRILPKPLIRRFAFGTGTRHHLRVRRRYVLDRLHLYVLRQKQNRGKTLKESA